MREVGCRLLERNQIKQENQAISDLSVYEFEKYFKQLKKIKRIATLKSHWAAIIHALKQLIKKGLSSPKSF
jgi:nitrate reductase assembly molybdenum cofactor insertion protein NarJ